MEKSQPQPIDQKFEALYLEYVTKMTQRCLAATGQLPAVSTHSNQFILENVN